MILPVGASSFKEAMKMGVEVYHHLKVVSSPLLSRSSTFSYTKRLLCQYVYVCLLSGCNKKEIWTRCY